MRHAADVEWACPPPGRKERKVVKTWILAGSLASSLFSGGAGPSMAQAIQQYTQQVAAWEQQILQGLSFGWEQLLAMLGIAPPGAWAPGGGGTLQLPSGTGGAVSGLGTTPGTVPVVPLEAAQPWRTHIHHLPRLAWQHTVQAGSGVTVSSGDRGVSASAVREAANIIQQVSVPLLTKDVGQAPSSAQVVLFSTRQAYSKALLQAGLSSDEAAAVAQQTGGLTIGTSVWIPLYNLQDSAELTNVLTHELTHVVYNERGIGDRLPTWLDEGAAWREGLAAEVAVNPQEAQALAAAYNAQLQDAAAQRMLLPLSANEQDILGADYNVEWQDYLAVQQLVDQYGEEKFRTFLDGVPSKGADASFQAVYGMSLSDYQKAFEERLG